MENTSNDKPKVIDKSIKYKLDHISIVAAIVHIIRYIIDSLLNFLFHLIQ